MIQITASKKNHLLVIPERLDPDTYRLITEFPAWSRFEGREAIVRINGVNLDYILSSWPDAQWIGSAADVRDEYQRNCVIGDQVSAVKAGTAELVDDGFFRYAREPMEHQRKAFVLSRNSPAFALLMEQGTGKTKVVIDNACYLFNRNEIDALIIVAWPNGVHRNWIDYELPVDMSVPYVAGFWASNHKTIPKRQEIAALYAAPPEKLKVYAFNVECFISDTAKEVILKMLKTWRCLFVVDQSASIKNPEAKRTAFLVNKASKLAPFRRVLDGAPVAEGADELYSQFAFLDPKIIGHDTWTGFKAEFCEIGFFKNIEGYKNLPILREKIDGFCFRVLADDCLDLPDRVYKVWPFDLTAKEQRIFDDLRVKNLAFFDDDVTIEDEADFLDIEEDVAEHIQEHRAMIKNLRLQQIASGWWPGDDYREIEGDGNASRLEALSVLLQQNSGKALIFGRFRRDLEAIQKLLGKEKCVSYHGGINEEDRADAKRRFMQDDKTLYFVGQPMTAGIGHTLTAAKHIIFYNNHPSLRLREECEKRAHRQGLKHTLMVWDLVARGSHDNKVLSALRAKKELSRQIMQDPDNFFLNHE